MAPKDEAKAENKPIFAPASITMSPLLI